ncbi:MBOAT family protein [Kriegella sp. EG-1]|nr:MBOAT family protein [Flavobacteriaceae bacterium EG-1]
MIFNSIDFAIFLPIVFSLYWFVFDKNLKYQNIVIVIASYLFYGWWDWRFLALIFVSSLIDFSVGIKLEKENGKGKRKILLWLSVIVNLGLLGFFKYYNFFLENFISTFSFFGIGFKANTLNIILPVGISFYTFQTLSYTIDVYKEKLKPSHNFISFLAFVSFFPQLVAGPIERATNLLPQFYKRRLFSYKKGVDGIRQIVWGLFKKIVIADNCAKFTNEIFTNYASLDGSTLVVGAILFTFQIYGDFSGYSDIAIGTARLFGFELKQNFAFPYFSRDMAEFWRRWHISLSTWFRDYLYIPLGGSRGKTIMKVRNVFIIFLVSGFWHGANWTFVLWGLLNACYFIPIMLTNRNRNNTDTVALGKIFPTLKELLQMSLTFGLTTFAWVFFRAENITHALSYIKRIFSSNNFLNLIPQTWGGRMLSDFVFTLCSILILMVVEWFGREQQYGIETMFGIKHRYIRWIIYLVLLFYIITFAGSSQDFIYFQF